MTILAIMGEPPPPHLPLVTKDMSVLEFRMVFCKMIFGSMIPRQTHGRRSPTLQESLDGMLLDFLSVLKGILAQAATATIITREEIFMNMILLPIRGRRKLTSEERSDCGLLAFRLAAKDISARAPK